MENLSLFSLSNTSLFRLEEGERHLLLQEQQLDVILVELKDPLDIEILGLNYLCFLTWLLGGQVLSLPLLSGVTITRQKDGFLVMLGPKMIYFLQFESAEAEVYDSFKLILSEFTRVNCISVGKTLPEQLNYIYGKEEQHHLSLSNVPPASRGPGDILVKASEYLQFSIVSAAKFSGWGIQTGSNYFIANTNPQGEYHVPEAVKKGLDLIASAANKVSGAAKAVVDTTSDFITHGTQAALSHITYHEEKGNVKVPSVLKATGSFFLQTLESYANVYGGVIEGTEIIVGDLSKSTVDVATHRYGQHVGELTTLGMKAFQSSTKAASHVTTFIHPTRFARAITKTTGKRIAATKKDTQDPQEIKSEISLKSLTSIAANPSFTNLPRRSNERIVVSLSEIQKTGIGSEENLVSRFSNGNGGQKEKEKENNEDPRSSSSEGSDMISRDFALSKSFKA